MQKPIISYHSTYHIYIVIHHHSMEVIVGQYQSHGSLISYVAADKNIDSFYFSWQKPTGLQKT